MSNQLNFEFDVRIPNVLIQQMMDGEITCAMYVTMSLLYKWANWATGRVRFCSSGGLVTATHKAYSDRTFRISLQRLEEMGWITRHMVAGSHKSYAVTIHNYKVADDAGKVHILNQRDIKVSDPYEINPCRETSHETSHEGSQETSHEGSQRTSLKNKSNNEPENELDLLPETDEGRKEGKKEVRLASLDAMADQLHNQETSQRYEGENDTEETNYLWEIWKKGSVTKHTYFRYNEDGSMDEIRDAKALIAQHGLETVAGYLADTFNCTKTAKLAWEDFWFWAKNFDRTKKNIDIWRRVKRGKEGIIAVTPGTPPSAQQIEPDYTKPLYAGGQCIGYEAKIDTCETCGERHNGFCPVEVAYESGEGTMEEIMARNREKAKAKAHAAPEAQGDRGVEMAKALFLAEKAAKAKAVGSGFEHEEAE